MAVNPTINARGDELLGGGDFDPRTPGNEFEAPRGFLYIYVPEGGGDAELLQKQDNGSTNNYGSLPLDAMQADFSNADPAANDIDLGSNNIVNLADPANAQDAATKNYVDTEIAAIPASASRDLSNLLATNINQNLRPGIDTGENLGEPTRRWEQSYVSFRSTVGNTSGTRIEITDNDIISFNATMNIVSNGSMVLNSNNNNIIINPGTGTVDFTLANEVDFTGVTVTGLPAGGDAWGDPVDSSIAPAGGDDGNFNIGASGQQFGNVFTRQLSSDWNGGITANQINVAADLIPLTDGNFDLGNSSRKFNNFFTEDANIYDSLTMIDASTPTNTLEGSGVSAQLNPGNGPFGALTGGGFLYRSQSESFNIFAQANGANPGPDVNLFTREIGNFPSGDVNIFSGNVISGAVQSGNITLTIGSSTGTQGDFKFLKSGVAPNVGDVWTASAADGTGYWAAPAGGGDAWGDFVDATIRPDDPDDGNFDLGTSTAAFNNLYVQSISNPNGNLEVADNLNPDAVGNKDLGDFSGPRWSRIYLKTGVDVRNTVSSSLTALYGENNAGDGITIGASFSYDGVIRSFADDNNDQQTGLLITTSNHTSEPGSFSGKIDIISGEASSSNFADMISGAVTLRSGDAPNNDQSGDVTVRTGHLNGASNTQTSGALSLSTGNNAGSGNSGNISIATGTSASGTRGDVSLDGENINYNSAPNIDHVWESGATGSRPGSPVVGHTFFDTTLGQPIWYDGTNWVDAQGTTV